MQLAPTPSLGPQVPLQRRSSVHSSLREHAAPVVFFVRQTRVLSQYASGAHLKPGHGWPFVGSSVHTLFVQVMRGPQLENPWHGVPGAGSFRHTLSMHEKGALQIPPCLQPSPRLPPSMQRREQGAPLQLNLESTQSVEVKHAPFV